MLRQGQPIVSLGAKGSHIVKHGGTLHNANEAIRAWLAVAAERPRTVAATCHRTLFIQHAGVTCQFTPSMDRILAYFSVHERDYLSRGSTRATQLSVLPLSGEELLHGLRLGDLPLSYSNTAMASYRKRWASAERPSSEEARVLASAAIAALVQEEPVVHTANIELSHRLMCLKNDRRTSEIWIFEPDGRRVKGYIGPPPPA